MIVYKDHHSQALSYLDAELVLDNIFLDLELQEEEEYYNNLKDKEDFIDENY